MKNKALWITCATAVMVGAVLVIVVVGVFDLQPVAQASRGTVALFEDSSFIISPVSWWGLKGCIPFTLCSEIGVDSPWEDFMPWPFSDIMYGLISIYKFAR